MSKFTHIKKGILKPVIAAFLFAAFLFACTHKTVVLPVIRQTTNSNNNNNSTSNEDTTKDVVDTSVCFERDILPIFTGSCALSGCHNASSGKDGYVFTTYATIVAKGITKGNAGASKVYTECTSRKMPKSPVKSLDSTQLSLLSRWINMGATDDTDCAVNCDTTKFTYSGAIVPILSFYCYSCHAAAAARTSGGGYTLDNYDSLHVQAQNGNLAGGVEHLAGYGAMPLNGAQLSECKITQIKEWIAAGALNN